SVVAFDLPSRGVSCFQCRRSAMRLPRGPYHALMSEHIFSCFSGALATAASLLLSFVYSCMKCSLVLALACSTIACSLSVLIPPQYLTPQSMLAASRPLNTSAPNAGAEIKIGQTSIV